MKSTLLIIAMLITGCSALTPEGQMIRVTNNPLVVTGCEFVGNVKGSSGWGDGAVGENQVHTKMQNATAKIGGNILFILSSRGSSMGYSGTGEAYSCARRKP